MRSLELKDGVFVISDDPDDVLWTMLTWIAKDLSRDLSRLQPDGSGFSIPEYLDVRRADSEDVPESLQGREEIWAVTMSSPGSPAEVAWIEGEELRSLCAKARRLHVTELGRTG